ncbi:MAG: cupin domain-containing protein [Parasphingopyxis sp.]|uniref:cupin domain-containing protein n=1 Tax=Parasphingopyxis sp. TaxID=1920299 RepID=UPI0032EC15E7
MPETLPPVRRIVTGHDADGYAIIQEDGAPPRAQRFGDDERATQFVELWNTRATPAPIDAASGEPAEDGIILHPPKNGTRIRIVDFVPEDPDTVVPPEAAKAAFTAIGAGDALRHEGDAPRHPFMHRTESIDYGIVLEGEITLLVENGETVVRAGDIVIQRGTSHAWSNRSGKPCRVCFVLIDGEFDPALGF